MTWRGLKQEEEEVMTRRGIMMTAIAAVLSLVPPWLIGDKHAGNYVRRSYDKTTGRVRLSGSADGAAIDMEMSYYEWKAIEDQYFANLRSRCKFFSVNVELVGIKVTS